MGSSVRDLRLVHPAPRPRQRAVPNEVLGTVIFVLTEAMMFAGFISAFTIARSSAPMWPPPGQPMLPFAETAVNTLALLASGATMWWAGRRFERVGPAAARLPLGLTFALGAFFVGFQGMEWADLLREGLTLTSSTHGAFFFLIVGAHALHAVCGLVMVSVLFARLVRERLTTDGFWAARVFWFFVVLLWPVLYAVVYR